MAALICLVRAFHSMPIISKCGRLMGRSNLRPGAPATASAIPGVISAIIELGTRVVKISSV